MEHATEFFKDNVRTRYERATELIPSVDAERLLVERAKKGDLAARNLLLEKQIPQLLKMAKSSKYGMYKGNTAEMVSVAALEFDSALRDFDPSTGFRFFTFFRNRAFNAMNKECYEDRLIHVPENYVKAGTANEIANVESGDVPCGCGASTVLDMVEGSAKDAMFDEIVQVERERMTEKLLGCLGNSREREIVHNTFRENMSVAMQANEFGMAKSEVKRHLRDALARMKAKADEERVWCDNKEAV